MSETHPDTSTTGWEPPWRYRDEDERATVTPIDVVRDTLEWIARPHGLTAKRCPKDERLREAEDMATAALEALAEVEKVLPKALCSNCRGRGWVNSYDSHTMGQTITTITCKACGGTGRPA